MLADFFAGTVDDWSDPGGMLHAYLVPDAATIDRLRPALRALEPLDFLAPQLPEALHAARLRPAPSPTRRR